MSVEKVRKYLQQWKFEERVIELADSSATVELAAAAINCEPKEIAKTLAFKTDEKSILVVAAGDAKIDNTKYKSYFGTKAKMFKPDELIEAIGYPMGGVCPFGVNEGVEIYLDESLKRFKMIYPAGGSGKSMVKLTPDELEECTAPSIWVDLCKGWGDTESL